MIDGEGAEMRHQMFRRPSVRAGCCLLLLTGLLALGLTNPATPVLANGLVQPCDTAPSVPANPENGILTGTVVDKTTSSAEGGAKAVPGAFIVASDNDVPYVQTLPSFGNVASSGACDSQSRGQFVLDLTGVDAGKEFVIGVGAPNGYASQWAPSGDRYLAEVYRKTSSDGFEKRLPNSSTWVSVSAPVSISLARGNSMVVSFSVGGFPVGEGDLNVTVWGVTPGRVGLTYGGGYSSLSSSLTRVQGLALGQHFLLQIHPGFQSTVSIKSGFVKMDGAGWTLVRDEREATVFYSPQTAGQPVQIGNSGGAPVPGVLPITVPVGRTVSGMISSQGAPVQGACVGLFEKQSVIENNWQFGGSACAGPDGTWSITGVAEGDYLLWSWDTDDTGRSLGLIPGFYRSGSPVENNQASATTITVASVNVTGVSVLVNRGISVSGTISGRSLNSEICVNAWREGEVSGWREWVGGTCSRSSTYALTVPAGTYRFEYWDRSGNLRTVWASPNSSATSYEDASDVAVNGAVSASNQPLLAVAMSAGASITGTISLQSVASPEPLPSRGICVSALEISGSSEGWGKWLSGTCEIGEDGSFRLGGLPSGKSVKLRFESFNGTHRSVFLKTGSQQGTSQVTDASLVPTSASNITIQLPSGTSIEGTVTASGSLLPGACFSVLDADWKWLTGTCSPDGNFRLSGLPNSDIRVWVSPPRTSTVLRGGWLQESGGVYSLSSSSTTISASTNLSGVTIPVLGGVSLAGTVTTGALPLVRACLSAFSVATDEWLGRACSNATNGTYTLNGLPPGAVVKLFVEPLSNDFARDWHRDGSGSVVLIDLASPGSGANVTLSSLTGGSISGRVSDASNDEGVSGLVVFVKAQGASATSSALAITSTDVSGKYVLRGLAEGPYELSIVDPSSSSLYVQPNVQTVNIDNSSASVTRNVALERQS